jgi:GNAT superfamily N-acetyltransferase
MDPIHYREATHEDVPALARIRAAVWETEEYWRNRITGYLERTHHPQQALEPRIIFVAAVNDAIIGFIAGHLTRRLDCDAELEWIDVVAEQRGRGIAESLINHLARWFAAQQALRVCVNVSPENTVARRLYARCGAIPLNKHWMVWPDIRVAITQESCLPPAGEV